MKKKILSERELEEIKLCISHYSSLDLDIGSPEERPNSERDFLTGLIKLLKNYEMNPSKANNGGDND